MLKCKEIKGTVKEPNIEDKINQFFMSCNENIYISNIYYSTSSLPYRNPKGNIGYLQVSSALILYNDKNPKSK